MNIVLNVVYASMMVLLAPWILYRVIFQGKNRRGWGQKLLGLAPIRESGSRCIWIHAVSVGEVNLLAPLICEFEDRDTDIEIAISTTTETGFDLSRKKYPDKSVFFCPIDLSWAVKNTIRRLRPDLLLLTELELWPNLVSCAHSSKVPVALINGRISQKSFQGYNRFRFIFSWLLKHIDVAMVQTRDYADRLQKLGMHSKRIHVCGNLKFDAMNNRNENLDSTLFELANIHADEFVFVAGSTQENEDRMAIDLFAKLKHEHPNLRMILVPRHPDRAQRLIPWLERKSLSFVFRSQLKSPTSGSPVLIVDTIGELKQCWHRAGVAYVGGSMGTRGGQNMIEPIALGVPTCFGPETENFKDIVHLLLANDAAQVVRDSGDLETFIQATIAQESESLGMALRGQKLVQAQAGSTAQTVDLLEPWMGNSHSTGTDSSRNAA